MQWLTLYARSTAHQHPRPRRRLCCGMALHWRRCGVLGAGGVRRSQPTPALQHQTTCAAQQRVNAYTGAAATALQSQQHRVRLGSGCAEPCASRRSVLTRAIAEPVELEHKLEKGGPGATYGNGSVAKVRGPKVCMAISAGRCGCGSIC